MCGILGVLQAGGESVDLAAVRRGSYLLRHRGPDDEGYLLVDTGAGTATPCAGEDTDRLLDLPAVSERADGHYDLVLAHRRLSILDLSTAGHQPMQSHDGRCWIVYNGEIYNYLELRRELEALGHVFQSDTDTEVLLAAYCEWREEALLKLVGMFAFAVLDTVERSLFLARDPFGIKPLYHAYVDGTFAFASEIKALLALPCVRRTVDPEAAYFYLRHGLTDHGPGTLFAGIRQVPPAHFMRLSLDDACQVEPRRYWAAPEGTAGSLSLDEAAERVRSLFLENVALHLRSDVPLGAALSGGVDSSSIVAAMRRIQGKGAEIHAFTYVADDPAISEESWADTVGLAVGAEMHKTRPNARELRADLESLIRIQDEPFGSTSIYAQHRVFQLAQETGIKVMLDGQGADELLAGYPFYLSIRLASLFRRCRFGEALRFFRLARGLPGLAAGPLAMHAVSQFVPSWLRGLALSCAGEAPAPSWMNDSWFREHGVEPGPAPRPGTRLGLRGHLREAITRLSLPMLLRYEDRNSMACSLESRVPFLTRSLVEFVLSLPEDYIIDGDCVTKAVFRQAMAGTVPAAVLARRDKIGFAPPERAWLAGMDDWVREILQSEVAASIPMLTPSSMKLEWERILDSPQKLDPRFWRWINLIRWADVMDVRFL